MSDDKLMLLVVAIAALVLATGGLVLVMATRLIVK